MQIPSRVRAERVISNMPFNEDVDVRTLARTAGVSVKEMGRFLSTAKKRGAVKNRSVVGKFGRMALWRRIGS